MKRKIEILLLAFSVLLLVGCDRPPISQEKMEDILFDIYRTDAYIAMEDISMTPEKRVKLYDSVFEKHGITKQQFDEALDWYAHHTSDWKLIHNNLVTRSEEYQKRVENYEFTPEAKPVVQDSIDTFDLWAPKSCWKWVEANGNFDRSQSDFTLDDRKYFVGAKSLIFTMKMRCWNNIGESDVTTMMVLKYSKGANDTLRYKARADSVERIYTLTKRVPESTSVSMVRVQVIDTVGTLQGIVVNDAHLYYTYNKHGKSIREIEKVQLRELRRELRSGGKVVADPFILRPSLKPKSSL